MINSLLDLDLYKLTVQQIVFHRFSNVETEYTFKCRDVKQGGINLGAHVLFKYVTINDVREAVSELNNLKLTQEEYKYLKTLGYFQKGYLRFLQNFRFNVDRDIILWTKGNEWGLKAQGPWTYVILYETLILSIVNELFAYKWMEFNQIDSKTITQCGIDNLSAKTSNLNHYLQSTKDHPFPLKIVEFGTRRRFSAWWQSEIIKNLCYNNFSQEVLAGTSNIHFSRQYKLKVVGTIPHELPMVMQSQIPVHKSTKYTYKLWLDEYKGELAICLPDTLGHEKFWNDFDLDLARRYQGVRHDSGCAYKFARNVIDMYLKYNISPKTKRIVFSDGLNVNKAIDIHKNFGEQIQCSFGIGTNLTNDVGLPTPQIVMKVTRADGQPVAKLSENKGKASCEDAKYVDYLKHAIKNY